MTHAKLKSVRTFHLVFRAGPHSLKEKMVELATCQSENYLALEETSEISWSNSFIVQMGETGAQRGVGLSPA